MTEHHHPHKSDTKTKEEIFEEWDALLKETTIPVSATPTGANTIVLSEASPEQIDQAFQDSVTSLGAPAFMSRVLQTGSYENLLFYMATMASSERLRTLNAVLNIPKEELASFQTRLDTPQGTLADSYLNPPKAKGGKLTGAIGSAVAVGASSPKNVRRVSLMNSGFTLELRAPTSDDCNMLLMQCGLTMNEYGRRIGAVYYAYFDLILKQHFIQMVIRLTVGASLKNWDQAGALLEMIKLQDLNHIETAMAALLYPEGWSGFRHICTREISPKFPTGCGHVTHMTLNLNTMIRNQYAKLNAKAIEHLARARTLGAEVTREEIAAYQKELGFDGRQISYREYKFHMKTATLADHLECGELFNKELLMSVDSKNHTDISTALKFRRLRMFLPSIQMMEIFDADGENIGWTDEKQIISDVLDKVSGNTDIEETLYRDFITFMDDSQLTSIVYPSFECPECHNVPDSEFIPVDAESTFFTLAWTKYLPATSPATNG